MKRLQTQKSLKHSMKLAMVGLIAVFAWLATDTVASAAVPTLPPVITAKPSDPNTTVAAPTFSYEVDAAETEPVTALQCRQYPTANPPATPTTGFHGCENFPFDGAGSRSYPGLNNVSQTFEVLAFNSSGRGPRATYVWQQNVSAPTQAPVLTSKPDDPSTKATFTFAFGPGAGDEQLLDRYQCRLDSHEESDWNICGYNLQNPEYNANPGGNGEHTFEVRGGNAAGFTPVTEFTWTIDIANPEPGIDVRESAITRWDGAYGGAQVGSKVGNGGPGVTSIGDVNGDGLDDLIVGSRTNGAEAAVYVVYGDSHGQGTRNLDSLSASEGYKITSPDPYFGGALRGYRNAGDQNGDGINDLMIAGGLTADFWDGGLFTTYVLYGGLDAGSLPLCPGSTVNHCQNLPDITDAEGYSLTATPQSDAVTDLGQIGNAGDFDGDGIDDLLIGGSSEASVAYVIKGGVRTGQIDISTLPASQVLQINRGAIEGYGLGSTLTGVGDVNSDGFDDAYIGAFYEGGGRVIYGHELTTSPLNLEDFGDEDGYRIFAPGLSEINVVNVGDVNGDGHEDLAASSVHGIQSHEDVVNVFYGRDDSSGDPYVIGTDQIPGTGYPIRGGSQIGDLGTVIDKFGDFDNDGLADFVFTAPSTPIDGKPSYGASYVVFGQKQTPESGLDVGTELTPGTGVAFLAGGGSIGSAGDVDGDGLTDFAVGGPSTTGGLSAGAFYIVPGKALINQVKTGDPVSIANESAKLKAPVQVNGRDTDVWFEYGTGESYGSTSSTESFEASNNGNAAVIGVDGLTKGTEYHYRAVAKNALGLVRYGDDKTFTTTNVDPPDPGSNCDTDDTLPGCANYDPCAADSTDIGCKDYDVCAAQPNKCVGGKTNAKLGLITSPKTIKVKRGKKGSVSAIVFNSGGKQAKGVKVCVKAPKRFVKVKKCLKVGKLASGATKTKTFKVKVKKKARKGKKITLKFTATSKNAGKKTTKAKVVVKK